MVSPTRDGTTAGRLLDKRGDGGYMIIMQTEDAKKRRDFIEEKGLGRVIWGYEKESEGVICAQYHPRGVKGMRSGILDEASQFLHTLLSDCAQEHRQSDSKL